MSLGAQRSHNVDARSAHGRHRGRNDRGVSSTNAESAMGKAPDIFISRK
jgi:hypothetical protein